MDSTEIAQQPEKLPRLIAQAAAALAKATGAAEVLDVKAEAALIYNAAKAAERFAKAKNAHDEIIAACHNAMRDALRIEKRAQIRLAEEFDAAQMRGELSSPGRPKTKNIPEENNFSSKVTDIGLTSKQVHEARRMRDAEKAQPGLLEKTLATGEPTRARVNRAVDEALTPPKPPPAKVERAHEHIDPTPRADEPRDCFLCNGIGTITWGQPMRGSPATELDTLRQFATFIMANLHDGTLTLAGDPKRMQRFHELKERVNPLIPATARV
jgi:hypothetical protein